MAKIKFNLNFGGAPIRTLEELRENFSIEDALDNYHSGALARWLDSRGYAAECEQVSAIATDNAREILKALLPALGVQTDPAEVEETLSLFDYLEQRKTFWAEIKAGNYDKVAKKARGNKVLLGNLAVGETVTFGRYTQTQEDIAAGEKSPIEWLVLAEYFNHFLLISKYGLDCKQYHHESTSMTWEHCDLRSWLNNEFMNATFTGEEQNLVRKVRNDNPDNATYDTSGGQPTDDLVFLLSIDEAHRYFKDDAARQCQPTIWAREQGAYVNDNNCCWWWLRSPGYCSNYAAYVILDGSLRDIGFCVDSADGCVRPALWVSNLES